MSRNQYSRHSNKSNTHCRRKLQQNFEECTDRNDTTGAKPAERSVLSVLSLNDTRKVLRNGAERLTRTFNSFRTTFGTISQKFRISTKRRQILEEGPVTPHTATKQVLGRTPTKLYSPFGIESPYSSKTCNNDLKGGL